jgi:hypothetical protein
MSSPFSALKPTIMPAPLPSAVLNSNIASTLSIPRALHLPRLPPAGQQMKPARGGAPLLRRKASGDGVPSLQRRQVPSEGQDVPPVAVLMEQGADLRRMPGSKRRLEGCEPILGRAVPAARPGIRGRIDQNRSSCSAPCDIAPEGRYLLSGMQATRSTQTPGTAPVPSKINGWFFRRI